MSGRRAARLAWLAPAIAFAGCSIDTSALQASARRPGEPLAPPSESAIANAGTTAATSSGDSGAAGASGAAPAGAAAPAQPALAAGSGGTPGPNAPPAEVTAATCGRVGLPCCMPGNSCDLGACLRGKCTPYGGFYGELLGCSTANPCSSRNTYTAGCSCPSGFDDSVLWRESVACGAAAATLEVRSCTSGRSPESAFGGLWVEAPAPATCQPACSAPNPSTGGCSCPSGTSALALPIELGGSACAGARASLQLCVNASGARFNFGGVYALSQSSADGCALPNPLTGACSCPAGVASPQSLHVGAVSVFACSL